MIWIVPANVQISPTYFSGRMVTDATVADRTFRLRFQMQGHDLFFCPNQNKQTASSSYRFYCNAGTGHYYYQIGLNWVHNQFPEGLILSPSDSFAVETTGIQAGDGWSELMIGYKQYVIPD